MLGLHECARARYWLKIPGGLLGEREMSDGGHKALQRPRRPSTCSLTPLHVQALPVNVGFVAFSDEVWLGGFLVAGSPVGVVCDQHGDCVLERRYSMQPPRILVM